MANPKPPILIHGRTTDGVNIPVQVDVDGIIATSGGGGSGGGGAVTVANGADIVEGHLADAAVVGDTSGTVAAKLRGISQILNDEWDSTNHWAKVSIQNTSIPVTAAALPLPSGASTAANQATEITSLASIDGKVPALGQAVAGSSVPVVLPAAQITTLTPPAAITGFATSAKQDTGNTSIASIDTKTPALGQALAAASVPIVLTSAQITTLTPPAAISGFATVAKQPALGTAGAASTDVISVQGIASMTPIAVTVATIPSHAVTNAGTFAVQATEADGANVTLGSKADAKSTATDTTAITAMQVLKQISASVQAPPSQAVTNAGTFVVQSTLQASSGTDIGKLTANQSVNVAQVGGTNVAVTNPLFVTPTPSTTGGWSPSKKAALSNTNAQVKSGAGTLGGWFIYNPNSSVAYVQIYDTATGSITVGTTAAVMTLGIPATSAANLELSLGINFATAICVAATTTAGGGTAPSTALDCTFWYK